MDTLIRISDDGASPTLELSVRLPAGAQVAGLSGHPAGPAAPAIPAPPASPAFPAFPAVPAAPAIAAAGPARGSVGTWALSTGERALSTFAASFLSALGLSGPLSIPAVDVALFAAASAALSVVTAAIRSLSPPTDDKALDIVTRTGLTLLQAFTAAFVTSTAGAMHFSDWRAGALAGAAGAFSALKGTLAVRIDGQKPTPASLVPLRPGPATVPAVVSGEAPA